MALLYTLLALGALIALHELGHLLIARASGMRVDRYSIGFGPALFIYRHGETEYALSLLPFGGYVKIAGMNPHDGTDPEDPRSYQKKPAWKRFLVISAGPLANYAITFGILAALYMVGVPKPLGTPSVGEVQPSSPASMAGIKPGDLVVSVDGIEVSTFDALRKAILARGGKTVPVVVERGGRRLTLTVTPKVTPAGGLIGAAPSTRVEKKTFFPALGTAAADTARWNVAIVQGLAGWISGKEKVELGGTVAVVHETAQAARMGPLAFFATVAGISVFLALLNFLPLPALDGGRLVFLLIEMIRRRPVDQRVETAIHATGFLMLLALMVYLTIGDVQKLMRGSLPGLPDAAVDAGAAGPGPR